MTDEEKESVAALIVNDLWADLTDRRGIGQAFDGIDTETLIEMAATHREIVRVRLR